MSDAPKRPDTAPAQLTRPDTAPGARQTGNFAKVDTGTFPKLTDSGQFPKLRDGIARPATQVGAPRPESQAATSQKALALGKNLVAALYMLVRSVKLYDPDNAIFEKPLQVLLDTANAIIARDGKLDLVVAENNFYVNGQMVRVEGNNLESLKYLAAEMESRQVGGFNLTRPTTAQELKNFISIFAKDQQQSAAEDGLDGKKLVAMKLTKWKRIQEKLDKESDGQVDRKKYAMTVYARCVVLAESLIKAFREGKLPPTDIALRQMQEIVDLMREQSTQFLGMTCTGDGEKALAHHMVNTALLAVAFGSELGLTRPQLRELAYAAFVVDLPLAIVPDEIRFALEPERLQKHEVAILVQARRASYRQVLSRPQISRPHQVQLAVSAEAVAAFGKPTRDARGRITFVLAQSDPMQISRMVAVARYYDLLTSTVPGREGYGPEVALDVMWNQQRFRFDPELLAAFMKIMATQPIKHLDKKNSTVNLGA